jgi:hypothetical protein
MRRALSADRREHREVSPPKVLEHELERHPLLIHDASCELIGMPALAASPDRTDRCKRVAASPSEELGCGDLLVSLTWAGDVARRYGIRFPNPCPIAGTAGSPPPHPSPAVDAVGVADQAEFSAGEPWQRPCYDPKLGTRSLLMRAWAVWPVVLVVADALVVVTSGCLVHADDDRPGIPRLSFQAT